MVIGAKAMTAVFQDPMFHDEDKAREAQQDPKETKGQQQQNYLAHPAFPLRI